MLNDMNWRRSVAACVALAFAGVGAACGVDKGDTSGPSSEIRTGSEEGPSGTSKNRAPLAEFELEEKLPKQGKVLTFDASESRDPDGNELTYSWRFGDDVPGGGSTISHIYEDGGTFEVTLTVSDSEGNTSSTTKTVSVKDRPYPTGNSEVEVNVRDFDYASIEGVEVSPVGYDIRKETGEDGKVAFENLPAEVPLVFQLSKDGYANQVKRVTLPKPGTDVPLNIRMQKIDDRVTIDNIQNGGTAVSVDGATVEIPPNAVVDSAGQPVTGPITVEFTTVDISEKPYLGAFPGAFLGLEEEGDATPIKSVGALEVTLKQDDEELQIAPGEEATIEIPAYEPGAPTDADVPLWSLDESTGVWVKEGELDVVKSDRSPTQRAMRAEVGHFTYWNGDYPLTTPCKMKPKCKIRDTDGGSPNSLKSDELCTVTVSSQTSGIQGANNSCSTNYPETSGDSCQQDTDCEYEKEYQDCSGDTCVTKTKMVDTPGYTCYKGSVPGGQNVVDSLGHGICKKSSSNCPNALYCGSGNGSCSIPSGGIFQGASGQFSDTFVVDAKGNRHSPASDSDWGIQDPDAGNGWLWVPNVALSLDATARNGTLQGFERVSGNGSAGKDWQDGTAQKCAEPRPVIKMRHTCDNVCGKCEEERLEHFCELLTRCPDSAFTHAFMQGPRGVTSKRQCKKLLRNDFQKGLLQESIDKNRAEYNPSRAADCLDKLADLRNDASTDKCTQFSRKAWDLEACTGVVGELGVGDSCRHDLECKGSDIVCRRQPNTSSNKTVVDFNGSSDGTNDFENTFTEEERIDLKWDNQNGYIRWADTGSTYGHYKSNPGMFKYYVELPDDTRRISGHLRFQGHSFEDSGQAFYAVDAKGKTHMIACNPDLDDVNGVSCNQPENRYFWFDKNFTVSAQSDLERFYVVTDMENVHDTWWDEGRLYDLKVKSVSSGPYGICKEDKTAVENCKKTITKQNGQTETITKDCESELTYCEEFPGTNRRPKCKRKKTAGETCNGRTGECMPNLYCNVPAGQEKGTCTSKVTVRNGATCRNQNKRYCLIGAQCSPPRNGSGALRCRDYQKPVSAQPGYLTQRQKHRRSRCLDLGDREMSSGCRWDAYCGDSRVIGGTVCKKAKSSGESCSSDEQCLSDYCSGGYCVGPDKTCQ